MITETKNRKDYWRSRRVVKSNPFSCKSRERDYWVGIMATDGYVEAKSNRVGLSFKRGDENHLRKFNKFLSASVRIDRQTHTINKGLTSRLIFRSLDVHRKLCEFGVVPRKSLNLKLNYKLNFHVLRGIIDGDGSVDSKYNRIRIFSASKKFIRQLAVFLDNYHLSYSITHERDNTFFVLSICEQKSLIKLIKLLYNNASVCLTRKQKSAYQLRNKLMKSNQIR